MKPNALFKYLLLISLLCVGMQQGIAAEDVRHKSLPEIYAELDAAISDSARFLAKRNSRIAHFRRIYASSRTTIARYQAAYKLYKQYYDNVNDSALIWLFRCVKLAEAMGNNRLYATSMVDLMNQYAISGFYNEAQFYQKKIPLAHLKGADKVKYHSVCVHMYGDMAFYSKDSGIQQDNFRKMDLHLDTLYSLAPENSMAYYWHRTSQLLNNKKPAEALRLSNEWEAKVRFNTHDYALMAFYKAEIFKALKRPEEQKKWLALSAICDIRCAVMDQSSLWNLADILSKEGDTERAYRYMDFSWRCISRFSSHLRGWLVSPILMLISNNYRDKLQQANNQLLEMIAVISLLSVVLLAILFYVSKKRKQLAVARNSLKHINSQLEELNARLLSTNQKLSDTNVQLLETSRMKDEYLGKFLSTCSEYIDKLDNYRLKMNRKLKAEQYNELMRITSSEELKNNELAELFHKFDALFLHLFPNFVADFNALLREEHRITLQKEGQLTTDLRIFALIRLGIEESSRIAEFLHYSPNSIYNYRARIKGKALCARDEFEECVKRIGMNA